MISPSFLLCERFAELHELTNDYVYAEFINPEDASLETVTEALDSRSFLVYDCKDQLKS